MRPVLLAAVAAVLASSVAFAQPKPFSPGDVFIDRNGDTVQIVECRGEGYEAECLIRRLAASGQAPIDPARWWTVDTLRGSERYWLNNGGQPYAGPTPALPGRTTAPPPAAGAPVRQPPMPVRQPPAPVAPPAAGTGVCPKTVRTGPVPGSTPASPALFRQLLLEISAMGSYGTRWYSGRIDRMTVGAPVRNTVTVDPGRSAERLHDGAPPNAIMYPVQVRIGVCEGTAGTSSDYRMRDSKYMCFVDRDRTWSCGAY